MFLLKNTLQGRSTFVSTDKASRVDNKLLVEFLCWKVYVIYGIIGLKKEVAIK